MLVLILLVLCFTIDTANRSSSLVLVPLATKIRVGFDGGDDAVFDRVVFLSLMPPSVVSSEGRETD